MTLSLLEWRRRVAAMYLEARSESSSDPAGALGRFRATKDALFRSHPDSPVPRADRSGFRGLSYWEHDPALRFDALVVSAEAATTSATSLTDERFPLISIGLVHLPIGDLEVYWLDVYGGGVFLPFRDATSGEASYGSGRYLLDTVKGADLGGGAGSLILDFNYAYHPSCAYDPRWSCPLAPRANWLDAPIRAGERLPVPDHA